MAGPQHTGVAARGDPMTHQAPRRWLRFSLRSLFVLVLVVAAYFAGWRSATWTAEREKEEAVRKAVEELQAARERMAQESESTVFLGQRFLKIEDLVGRETGERT